MKFLIQTFYLILNVLFCFNSFGQNRTSIPDVFEYTRIGSATNFPGALKDGDKFGQSIAVIGDLDNDGISDLVVGAPFVDDMGTDRGAVYILFMDADRTVASFTKLSDSSSALTLSDGDNFGLAVAGLGDLDNDGIEDIAVSAHLDDATGTNEGAVYILFLNTNGTIKSKRKIVQDTDGELPSFSNNSRFGISLATLGDVNQDGTTDLAVGHYWEDVSGTDNGVFWVLLLNDTAKVLDAVKIGNNIGGFGALDAGDGFGHGLCGIGDFNGDSIPDLAVAAPEDDDGGSDYGAIYICLLDSAGTVDTSYKINQEIFPETSYYLNAVTSHSIGRFIAASDINQDGVMDLLITPQTDGTGGCFYILLMNSDGTCIDVRKIGDNNGFDYSIPVTNDLFGFGVTITEDYEDDGKLNIVCGAPQHDLGGTDRGAIYMLNMNFADSVSEVGFCKQYYKINDVSGDFAGTLVNSDYFGSSVIDIGDINGDGISDFGVGAQLNDDGATDAGGFWILTMDSLGTVSSYDEIHMSTTNFTGQLGGNDRFGYAACPVGDLDNDGVNDIVVSAPLDDDGGTNRGAIYTIFLNSNGTVKGKTKINTNSLDGTETNSMQFGISVANIGDLNNDGVTDIVVGANLDDDGGTDRGAAFIVFLDTLGGMVSSKKISDTGGSFSATFSGNTVYFGAAVAGIGDFNGDGKEDIAVTSTRMDSVGAIYLIYLDTTGAATGYDKISTSNSTFPDTIAQLSNFGISIANLGDIDQNGVIDLAIGHLNYEDYSVEKGSVWITTLNADGTVIDVQNVGNQFGRFYGILDESDQFSMSVCAVQDFNGDGELRLMVGSRLDDDGGTDRGAVFLLYLDKDVFQRQYDELKRKLDGGNYYVDNGLLLFEYKGEYSKGELNYKVYNNEHTVVASNTLYPGILKNLQTSDDENTYGDNRFVLDLSCTGHGLNSGYYVLEVTNEKEEKFYLRFYQGRNFICGYPTPFGN